MTKLEPLHDRVVIKAKQSGGKTDSGIYIPDTASKEKPEQGEVVAVGPGKVFDGELIPMTVKKGDTVLFSKYSPDEVEIDGQNYLIVREESLLAIVK
jgi:chaperonin GroES